MISINSNTRQFNIPGADLTFGVTGDSGTEVKNFTMPRYVGNNLDVASCFVRINYRNGNGETDTYLVNDVSASAENVTFSWVLTPKVTEYRGQIKFVVCLVGPDLKLKWHTTQGTGQVLEGLEPDNGHVESDTADVVASLIAMVEAQTTAVKGVGAEQIASVRSAAETARTAAVAEIEAKRANSLASIPNDYSALSAVVEKTARVTAPGIVCDVEGRVISVSDASDQQFRGLRVFGKSTQAGVPTPDAPVEIVSVESPAVIVGGKNLLENTLPTHSSNGITYVSNADGSITLNGTSTSESYFIFDNKNKIPIRDVPLVASLGGGNGTLALAIGCYKNDGSFINSLAYIVDKEAQVAYPKDAATTRNYLVVGNGRTFNNMTVYPALRALGTTAEYEPYKPVQTIETARPLHGIPLITSSIVTAKPNYIDGDGKRWVCDEVDLERGVYVQRIKKYIMDGTRPVVMLSTTPEKTRFDVDWIVGVPGGGVMCDSLRWDVSQQAGTVQVHGDTGKLVMFVDKATNAADFHAYLAKHPMTVLIQTTPTETPLTEAELAAYRTLHTNKPNTTILNDSSAHMSVKYTADTKLYIDNKIKEALQ